MQTHWVVPPSGDPAMLSPGGDHTGCCSSCITWFHCRHNPPRHTHYCPHFPNHGAEVQRNVVRGGSPSTSRFNPGMTSSKSPAPSGP